MSDKTTQTPPASQEKALLRVWVRARIAQVSDEMAASSAEATADASIHQLAERLCHTELDKTQIRGLETLAYTTNKISDITDWLKKQIGRDAKNQRWGKDKIGADVIIALTELRKKANGIVGAVPEEFRNAVDSDLSRRVHLDLCREFAKHLAAEFLYLKKEA